MGMKFEMKSAAGIPAGNYEVKFSGAEPFDEHTAEYGAAVKLKWEVTAGPQAGQETSRICSAKLSPKSNLGKFVTMLNGGALEPGAQVDLDSFVGVKGLAIVEEVDSGSTRVSTFLKSG